MSQAALSEALRRRIALWGPVVLVATVVRVTGSYGIQPYPHGLSRVRFALSGFLSDLGVQHSSRIAHILTGDIGSDAVNITVFSVIPLCISTLAFLVLWRRLTRDATVDASVTTSLFGWAIVIAAVQMAAMPGVEDFWVYLQWGKEVAHGINPYSTAEQTFALRMPYGPLWALIGGGIYKISGSLGVAAVVGKLTMFGAWVATLAIVRRLGARRSVTAAATAVLIFGWLPLSAEQTIAEGHNDIFMALGIVAWMWWFETRNDVAANLALVGSVLIKFMSAPLALLPLIRARRDRMALATALRTFGIAIAAGGLVCLIFTRDLTLLKPLWLTRGGLPGYRFDGAFLFLEHVIGAVGVQIGFWAARAAVLAVALYGVRKYARTPTLVAGREAAVAILLATILASGWRVFPWYFIWPLAAAAVAADRAVARWTVGVLIVMPCVWMWTFLTAAKLPQPHQDSLPELLMYLAGFAWIFVTRSSSTDRGTALANAPADRS